MEPKTRFAYVYGSLREQIVTGQWEGDTTLPSIVCLSEIYHVGVRTIKTVLNALSQEGLIRTQARKKAVVLYRPPLDCPKTAGRLLSRRTSILECFFTMELLMPDVLSFCARSYRAEVLWNRQPARKKDADGRWKTASILIHDVLHSSGNLLLNSLYTSLEVYAQIPFFMDRRSSFILYSPCDENRGLDWVVETLRKRDFYERRNRFQQTYHAVTVSVYQSFELLKNQFPLAKDDACLDYVWRVEGVRNPLYARIARTLMEQINAGSPPPGALLPSQSALAEQYGVSVATIRKAMSVVTALGFGQTRPGIGTVALPSGGAAASWTLQDGGRRNALVYLSGLQLLAFAVHPAARLAFDRMNDNDRRRLCDIMQKTGSVPLEAYVCCIADRLPLRPLEQILKKTAGLLKEGYDSVCFDSYLNTMALRRISRRALRFLLDGDRLNFADALCEGYWHCFQAAQELFIQKGCPEAARMRFPHDVVFRP